MKNGYLRIGHDSGGRMDFIRGLTIFCFCLVSGLACAAIAPSYSWQVLGDGFPLLASPLASCQHAATVTPEVSGAATAELFTESEYRCHATYNGTPNFMFAITRRQALACPSNSTLVGGSCVCASGATELDGACVVNDCPPAGTVEGDSSNAYEASSINPTICIGEGSQGCVWKPGGSVPAVCANGKCYQWGPFTATGASCDPSSTVPGAPSSAASAPPTDASCVAKGQCPGTIHGTTTCVPCGTKSQESVTSTSTAASSAASGAAPSTSTESGTTTTKTECSGSQCTTTTTTSTQKSDGSSEQKTSSKTEPQTDFCAANPKAAVCKGDDDSKWGGACAGGFTCSGDAVQCAQAQAAYDLSCTIKTDPQNTTVLAGAGAIGAGDQPGDHPANSEQTVSFDLASRLDSLPLFGSSGDCPSDVSASVGGRAITLPFSTLCPYMRMLGAALMACAYIAAAKIVFGD